MEATDIIWIIVLTLRLSTEDGQNFLFIYTTNKMSLEVVNSGSDLGIFDPDDQLDPGLLRLNNVVYRVYSEMVTSHFGHQLPDESLVATWSSCQEADFQLEELKAVNIQIGGRFGGGLDKIEVVIVQTEEDDEEDIVDTVHLDLFPNRPPETQVNGLYQIPRVPPIEQLERLAMLAPHLEVYYLTHPSL